MIELLMLIQLFRPNSTTPEVSLRISGTECHRVEPEKRLPEEKCRAMKHLLEQAPSHRPETMGSLGGFFLIEIAGKRYPVNYREKEECKLLKDGALKCRPVKRTPMQELLALLLEERPSEPGQR